MTHVTIYHNPRCSKSRQTLEIIKKQGISPEIREYLKDPITEEEMQSLLEKLHRSAKDIIRKNEAEYKENNLSDSSLTEEELIKAMVKYPKLIERPIVVKGNNAVLGRPPEDVLKIL